MQNSERAAYSDPPDSDSFTAKTGGDRGHVRATKERIICPSVNSVALHRAPNTGRCTPQPLGVWKLVTHSCVPVARPYSERAITQLKGFAAWGVLFKDEARLVVR